MMKRLLPLLLIVTALLCATASAASLIGPVGIPGQVNVAYAQDAYGAITALTDDQTTTTWTSDGTNNTVSFNLYSATVGEIWIRSGHCYSQNYFNHYDRPDVIRVTVWYQANSFTQSYDSYRYRMSDAFKPNTLSADWQSGYQRLLLPRQYRQVTKVELTIESTLSGFGQTGATLTDVAFTAGDFATATPKTYATATPRPYTAYVTPTPAPYDPDDYVEYITPRPTRDVTIITPEPTRTAHVEYITPAPKPTEPLVELITPVPKPPEFPTKTGVVATLNKRIATRTGPSNNYDEPGSFFTQGDYVNVIGKAYDDDADLYWYQVEFQYDGEWYRAYTPGNRINLDERYVPTELNLQDAREVLEDHRVYYGPGEEYKMYKISMLYKGSRAVIIQFEGEWAQIEYFDYTESVNCTRRAWVPAYVLSDWPFEW